MLGKTRSFNGVHLSQTIPFARYLFARHSCSKLFVGGLSYDTSETVLKDAFGQHGEIIEAGNQKVMGFFVQYTAEIMASKALKEMDGQLLDGRHSCALCASGVTTRSSGMLGLASNLMVASPRSTCFDRKLAY